MKKTISRIISGGYIKALGYPLDSEEYRIKMEIVEEFARQGVNYWDTEIDKYTLEQIKKALS